MVVEGFNAILAVMQLSKKYEVELPIISSVDSVVNHGVNPTKAVKKLMWRNCTSELRMPVLDTNYENAV